ncbi:hypothetical protein BS17DRAFT_789971 [Gyrodon lividus]|nr:hypothetical protein BS17DRAFT_789971 [Gyrodon lividus]
MRIPSSFCSSVLPVSPKIMRASYPPSPGSPFCTAVSTGKGTGCARGGLWPRPAEIEWH